MSACCVVHGRVEVKSVMVGIEWSRRGRTGRYEVQGKCGYKHMEIIFVAYPVQACYTTYTLMSEANLKVYLRL